MRIEGWEERLNEVIARHEAAPFAWGGSDCFTLCMDVVAAMTGADPSEGLRDYDTALSAGRRLRERGFETISDAFAKHFIEVAPAFARRGDIGIADYPGAVLGGGAVVLGTHLAVKSETGLVRLPRERLVRAFAIR